jgi:hypothetical protein
MSFINTRLGLATLLVCLAAVNVAGEAPQATQKKETVPKGPSMATTTQLRGEVVAAGPNWLLARMVPGNIPCRLASSSLSKANSWGPRSFAQA